MAAPHPEGGPAAADDAASPGGQPDQEAVLRRRLSEALGNAEVVNYLASHLSAERARSGDARALAQLRMSASIDDIDLLADLEADMFFDWRGECSARGWPVPAFDGSRCRNVTGRACAAWGVGTLRVSI